MGKKRVKRDMIVYAIVSKEENTVYVGKTGAGNHYEAYKNSVRGRKMETKAFFEAADAKNAFPPMYLLSEGTVTEQEAYKHMVIWTRYFLDKGMVLLNYPGTQAYARDLLPKNQTIYDQLKDLPIERVLQDDYILVASYTRRKHRA
ncbi:MAG: hypothetical protein IKV68_03220 [Oscillospiraceae bacterium]|nr:hypothetical protein [Oscillospiraceae bacterium]